MINLQALSSQIIGTVCHQLGGAGWEWFKGVLPLLAALIVARLGLEAYFRQKEYELVKQRYLEGAIDLAASEIEYALGTVKHNWGRCLHLLKMYRDSSDTFDVGELEKEFLEFNSSKFLVVTHQRIEALVGSDVFSMAYATALAHCYEADSLTRKEIPDAIRAHKQMAPDLAVLQREGLVAQAIAELERLSKDGNKFWGIPHKLQILAQILEKERLSFNALAKFRDRQPVRLLVQELQQAFPKPNGSDRIGTSGASNA